MDIAQYRSLPMIHAECKQQSEHAITLLQGSTFQNLRTSRTLKPCSIPESCLTAHLKEGIIEQVFNIDGNKPLPTGCHGVNVWRVPELKQRWRLISEPHLNRCTVVGTTEMQEEPYGTHPLIIPPLHYLPRAIIRTRLGRSRYMLQIDIDAFYNSVPVDLDMKKKQLFRHKNGNTYCIARTTTGGRWSVYVGQSITYGLTDISALHHCEVVGTDNEVATDVITMIDNILIHATEGDEDCFVSCVREIAKRIDSTKLTTSPKIADLVNLKDREILELATVPTVFLGEEYCWDETTRRRVVRNTTKTIAKLRVAHHKISELPPVPHTQPGPEITCRALASFLSLLSFGMHTRTIAPARFWTTFQLQRLVSAQAFTEGWDSPIQYLSPRLQAELSHLMNQVTSMDYATIHPPQAQIFYDDSKYDIVAFVDASREGWGAYVRVSDANGTTTYKIQQQWSCQLDFVARQTASGPATKFSALSEPRAAEKLLDIIQEKWPQARTIAVVSDHFAISRAARKLNGYGGIGRGQQLNRLFQKIDRMTEDGKIIHLYYVAGELNPADVLSRVFLPRSMMETTSHAELKSADDVVLPSLKTTFCPSATIIQRQHQWTR